MNKTKNKKLFRSSSDRMVSGVSAGLAEYLGVDVVFVRVGFIVATVMTSGAAAVGYLAMMLLVPSEDEVDDDHVDMGKSPLPV